MTTAVPALDLKRLKIIPLPSETALSDFRSGEDEIDRNLEKCCEWHKAHSSRTYCAYLAEEPDV